MHIMLRCFHHIENREHVLENILSIEKQYIILLGCTNDTTFENIIFENGNK